MEVAVPVVALTDRASIPSYAHDGDAGCDLVATEEAVLAPGGGRASVGCGIAIAIPEGGSKRFVPARQFSEGAFQGVEVEGSQNGYDHLDDV